LAAYHMTNLHQRIIDDDGKVIGRYAVGAYEHEVADDLAHEGDAIANEIVPRDLVVTVGNTKADHRGLAAVDALACLIAGDIAAAPHIPGRLHVAQRLVAVHLELLFGAEAVIRLPARHQLDGVSAVDVQALGLTIGPVRACG